jgi:hypothetical protein
MPGRPLCSVHAALDTEGSAEVAATLYTEDIHDEERRLWHQISVTDLDAEIRVAKLQLKRLLAAQRRLELHDENAPDETLPPEKTSKRMAAKPREIDYDERVNRLLGRISDLVVTRARLQRELETQIKERDQDPADDPVERLARRIDRVAARIGTKKDPGDAEASGGGETGA